MNMLGVPFAYFLASKTWLGKVLRKLLVTFHWKKNPQRPPIQGFRLRKELKR